MAMPWEGGGERESTSVHSSLLSAFTGCGTTSGFQFLRLNSSTVMDGNLKQSRLVSGFCMGVLPQEQEMKLKQGFLPFVRETLSQIPSASKSSQWTVKISCHISQLKNTQIISLMFLFVSCNNASFSY